MKKLLLLFITISVSICGFKSAYAQTCGTGQVSGFQFPIDQWRKTCGFNAPSGCGYTALGTRAHHTALDSVPASGAVVGTQIEAPCTGKLKEARYSDGHGGIVILECLSESGCVSVLMAHMYDDDYADTALKLKFSISRIDPRSSPDFDRVVNIGEVVGYLADAANNGGWGPHSHIVIRKGQYVSGNYVGCSNLWKDWIPQEDRTSGNMSNVWYYGGYAFDCWSRMQPHLEDPESFIANHMVTSPTATPHPTVSHCLGPVTLPTAANNWTSTCTPRVLSPFVGVNIPGFGVQTFNAPVFIAGESVSILGRFDNVRNSPHGHALIAVTEQNGRRINLNHNPAPQPAYNGGTAYFWPRIPQLGFQGQNWETVIVKVCVDFLESASAPLMTDNDCWNNVGNPPRVDTHFHVVPTGSTFVGQIIEEYLAGEPEVLDAGLSPYDAGTRDAAISFTPPPPPTTGQHTITENQWRHQTVFVPTNTAELKVGNTAITGMIDVSHIA